MPTKTPGRRLVALAALPLTLFATAARGDYLNETGMIQVIAPPLSLKIGDLQSNSFIRTFAEVQGLTLLSAVAVDDAAPGAFSSPTELVGGVIPAGTAVDSYLFHSDTASGDQVYDGSVTFTSKILGLEVLTSSLAASDAQFARPGTTYPISNLRGLEMTPDTDTFMLSADMRTVTLHFETNHSLDEVRVLTAAVPEPGPLALLGVAALALAGVALLRNRAPHATA